MRLLMIINKLIQDGLGQTLILHDKRSTYSIPPFIFFVFRCVYRLGGLAGLKNHLFYFTVFGYYFFFSFKINVKKKPIKCGEGVQ